MASQELTATTSGHGSPALDHEDEPWIANVRVNDCKLRIKHACNLPAWIINDLILAVANTNGLSNMISTTKYSLITWLPKSLWEQFRRIANVYFLLISVLMVFMQIELIYLC
jgi:hypothetical protein